MRKNLFIALEGIDGSGKSTQVKLLASILEKAGLKVYSTSEPTGGETGKLIRKELSQNDKENHEVIAALFLADRLEHILDKQNGLLKKLKEGYTVITDRYYFSSYAYHSVHMPLDWVIEINKPCAQLLRPDITIYIDVPPEESMKRIENSRGKRELYETLDNLTRVRDKYYEAFRLIKSDENILIVDGNNSPEQIADEIAGKVLKIKQK